MPTVLRVRENRRIQEARHNVRWSGEDLDTTVALIEAFIPLGFQAASELL